MDFAHLRQKALDVTSFEPSLHILHKCTRLVFNESWVDKASRNFIDADVQGAITISTTESEILYNLVRGLKPQRPLEIGSYIGWSSAHVIAALDDERILTCVDPFIEFGNTALHGRSAGTVEHVKDRFLANLRALGYLDRVRLVVGHSPDVLPDIAPKGGWDFAFIDGWHNDNQPMRDVTGVLPHITDNAVVVLHDLWLSDVLKASQYLTEKGWHVVNLRTETEMGIAWRGETPAPVVEALRAAKILMETSE